MTSLYLPLERGEASISQENDADEILKKIIL